MPAARRLLVVCLTMTLLLTASPGTQVVYEVVSDFGTSDGIHVAGSLVVEPDGTVYGTTQSGGQSNQGTIFRVDRFGVRTTLHAFSGPDGRYPVSGLTKGPDGHLYGTTNRGGEGDWGTIFRVNSNGSPETLKSFDPITVGSTLTGYFPSGGLTVGADGHLYGVTSEGGQFGAGVIFRVTTSGEVGVVHTFGTGAWSPNPWLTLGPDGALYGATRIGGLHGNGTLFRFVPGSGVAHFHQFAAPSGSLSAPEGRYPSGPLAVTADGTIYGTNQAGGPLELGTVFRLTNGGAFSVLHGFAPQDPATGQHLQGLYPDQGVTLAGDGHFYASAHGGANGAGVLLRVNGGTGAVSVAHTLDYQTTGSTVQTPLVQGADGRLFGATQVGAVGNYGALFAYDTSAGGAPSILHAFSGLSPISTPWSGLTKASDGRLYGTGLAGGSNHGGIFRLGSNGTTTNLHAFSAVDGSQPQSELTEGPDGALYGVTAAGGEHNAGTIFRIDTNGVLTRLHSFVYESGSCPDGCQPYGTLAVGADSALYGTTAWGGQHGGGVLYRITTAGSFSVRHHFGAPGSSDGAAPYGGLITGADGRIYGTTTQGGGPQQAGTVFVFDHVAGVTVLHPFAGSAGSGPHAPLVQGSDGMLYGTTRGLGTSEGGTVFRVDPASGAHATLHTLAQPADGAYPVAALVQGSDGAFYGVTSSGGADPGGGDYGTIFRITAAGAFSVLRTFNTMDGGGYHARGRLVEVDRGVFYGTTAEGGPTGRGTVFRLTVPMPPENTPPGANDGSTSTLEDTPVAGVLSAGDVDGDTLVFSLVSNGTLGSAVITNATTGAFTYTPHADVFGEDTFTFRVNDGQADSNVGTMTMTIVPANDAPVAYDGTLDVTAGASATGTLAASDVDGPTLSYALVANGARGTAVITNAATGAFTYTANAGAGGSDTFTFKATDGALESNVATVTVTIAGGNQAPVVLTGVVTTAQDTPVSGAFHASDPDGDELTFRITSGPAKHMGTVALLDAATGAFRYTPNAGGATGYTSFTFSVSDGQTSVSGTQMVFVVAASPHWPGEISRASVTSAGAQGSGISEGLPALSADGRFVAFESVAPLVSGDTNGARDVFVRDRQSGETTRVSVGSGGAQANLFSFAPAVSADGRFVAFHSLASNLVSGDSNGAADVFVHDRQTGATTRVSVRSDGTQSNGISERPVLSADGRFVAFHSAASNLVAGDTNGVNDVFVHDRQTGETTRVSVGGGGAGNNHSDRPKLSADGRYVVFHSLASNLVPGDTNGTHDVFVHDRQTAQTTRVSVASDGTEANYASTNPTISADGRYVAFHSGAWNLVAGDTPGAFNVFVRDRVAGSTTRASAGSGGAAGNGNSFLPALSADGRSVAFYSFATNLVPGDTNGTWDVFVVDRPRGETTRVSVGSGEQANGASSEAALSADGQVVAFYSVASNLVPGDTNNASDVFVVDGVAPPAPPTAENGTVSTSEDVPVTGALIASDPGGVPLTFALLSTGTLGTAVLTDAATGAFTYTPLANAHGIDTFTFKVSNGTLESNVATVTVTIAAVNDAPVAQDGELGTAEDTVASGILVATDVDSPSLTFAIVSNGTKGTAFVTNAATGAFSYTPNANAHGTDVVTFTASDGSLSSNVGTVTITIESVDDAPLAFDGALATDEDTPATGTLAAADPDGDAVTYAIVTNATKGRAVITNPASGAFVYTSHRNVSGIDSFTFAVSDGASASNIAAVTVTIAAVNDPPVAHSQFLYALEDAAMPINVAGSDVEGDALTYTLLTGPSHGSLNGSLPSVTYTPAPNYNGPDAFSFQVNDGVADSNVATVELGVVPTLWTSGGPHTGIVGELVPDATLPSVVYALSSGAVWKSTDAAATWSKLPLTVRGISMATVPGQPLTLYAGTTSGLYKSTDGGASWGLINDRAFHALVVDSTTPSTLFGLSQNVVFRSLDAGATWTSRSAGLTGAGRLVADPAQPETLYAIAGSALFKTIDAGGAWFQVGSGLPTSLRNIAVDPGDPSVLYAGTAGAGAFKSSDGALTWTAINTGLGFPYVHGVAVDTHTSGTVYAVTAAGVYKSSNAGASWVYRAKGSVHQTHLIALAPAAPTTVYIGGEAGVFRSTDGASTWADANAGFAAAGTYALATDSLATGVIYAGSYYAGVHKSMDSGVTWMTTGLSYFGTRALVEAPGVIYAGSTCSGVARSVDGGVQWTTVTSGLTDQCVNALAVDSSQPETVYAGTRGGVFRSTTAGASWSAVNNGLIDLEVNALVTLPGTLTVYAGTRSGLFKTVDGAESWLNTGLPASTPVNALAVDPAHTLTIYAATSRGLFKSVDGGASWFNATPTVLGVQSVTIDRGDSLKVYIGSANGVWATTNGGVTWAALPVRGLASTNVVSLALSGETLYGGTSAGSVSIYRQSPNDVPTATDQSIDTIEATAKAIGLSGSDPDGEPLTFTIVTVPSHGTLSGTAPNLMYTPHVGYSGSDSFTFKASDGVADSDVATVTITIAPVNDAPVANDGTLSTFEDTPESGTLTATDIDGPSLSFSLVSNGTLGTASITDAATGAYAYVPNPDAFGSDTFTFTATDGSLVSNVATITVTIAPVNDAPVAQDGTLAVASGASASSTLLASDVDSSAVTFTIDSNGAKGTAVITNTSTGAYTYTAIPGANGADAFTFTASDGELVSNRGTVTVTITAPVAPAAPSALSATAVSANGIALAWTDNASSEDGFKIERSQTNTNNFVQVATVGANVTTYVDADLRPATKYHYRVRAYVTATSLDSSYSNTATATTLSAPNAPTGLSATASSSTQINLAWADKSNNETGFTIERSTDGATFSVAASVGANVTTFADSGLAPSTTYHYRVAATNANGASAYSSTASATTHGTEATIPSAPGNLTATSANGLKITLKWSDTSTNELGFRVERSLDGTSFTEIATVGPDTSTFIDSGLVAMTTYHYRVSAYNNSGASPPSNTASAKTKAK